MLLDAHAVIWAADNPSKLGSRAAAALSEPSNDVLVSAGTIWEIAIKVGLGKLTLSMPYQLWMNRAIADLGLMLLPITVDHANAQASLPRHHTDPFDRLLIAQASVENLRVVSNEDKFDAYEIDRLW